MHAYMHDMAGVCDVSQAQVMHGSDVTGGPHLVPCHPTREYQRESVSVQPGPHFTISAIHFWHLKLHSFLPGVFHGQCMC